ncbi:MAG TPA: pyridoxamine 5'-phosphate oxidase family protein [Chloroflexota bacterium]
MGGHIPWGVVDRWLYATRSLWISTTRPDGRPHAMPVWFTWDGRMLYFATHETSQKAKNLAWQPEVVIHLGDGDDVVVLEGRTEIVTDRRELESVNAARAEKYVDRFPGPGTRFWWKGRSSTAYASGAP